MPFLLLQECKGGAWLLKLLNFSACVPASQLWTLVLKDLSQLSYEQRESSLIVKHNVFDRSLCSAAQDPHAYVLNLLFTLQGKFSFNIFR